MNRSMNLSARIPAASRVRHMPLGALALAMLCAAPLAAQELPSGRILSPAAVRQTPADSGLAAEPGPRLDPPGRGVACPRPVTISLTRNSGAASPYLPDMPTAMQTGGANGGIAASTFNQTSSNKWFGHTFHFKTAEGQCCALQPGQLTVTYRALEGGQVNDGSAPSVNGAPYPNYLPGYIWPQGATVTVGQTVTKSYVIPPQIMATGRVSFYAQDDTAVVSATLTGSGCCLEPTR